MKYPCSCNKCKARGTLPRHPDNYVRIRKCRAISCSGEMVLDSYRFKGQTDKVIFEKDHGGKTCYNDWRCEYWYKPHRIGSVGCFYE